MTKHWLNLNIWTMRVPIEKMREAKGVSHARTAIEASHSKPCACAWRHLGSFPRLSISSDLFRSQIRSSVRSVPRATHTRILSSFCSNYSFCLNYSYKSPHSSPCAHNYGNSRPSEPHMPVTPTQVCVRAIKFLMSASSHGCFLVLK